MKIPGKCLCGAIQFSVVPKAFHSHGCHCSMCRRQSGSLTLTVSCQGPPEFEKGKDLLTTFKSSEWGERCFCSTCGTNLFHNSPSFGYFGVSAGALDEQDKLTLEQEIYIDQKPNYYSFQGDHKRLTEAEFLASLGSNDEKEKE
ncbi:expressed unknown protein [Seminavis robusta]|uniref:CENP-V/GFA domain-containing protein n=1 Tax=Seminavis robusta TaxID=568900 RepID=A0A9N8DGA6_9STRA|nr:expressed unknown protein [Seminavis robusta]|eukprot:Sro137_g064361.1  (144) ;mRNA; r:55642-56073